MANTTSNDCSLRSAWLVAWLVLAHAPFLFLYFGLLNGLDHYGFFPFALAAFAWLCYDRLDRSRFRWNHWCTVLLGLDLLLVIAGVVVTSSWPVWLGLCCGASAICLASSDRHRQTNLLYATLPLWILVRPPFSMDLQLVGWLQKQTTIIASTVLHRLQIPHFRSGNVLEFADKTLLVEEACSGIQSLFAVLFVAVAVVAFNRRRLLQACALVPFAFLCAAVFNVVRVLCIAIAWDRWQWDLSTGVSHTMLGYVCLLAATLMVLSADQMIATMTNPIPRLKDTGGFKADVIALWNWIFEPHEKIDSGSRTRKSRQTMPRLLTSSALIIGVASLLFAGQVYAGFIGAAATTLATVQTTTDSFRRTDIPDQLGAWKQTTYSTEKRSISNSFGQFSNSWRYHDDAGTEAFISCDHSFRGWHNLEVCYQGRGWVIEGRSIVPMDSPDDWPAVEVKLTKPTGEHSFLIYSLFDAGGLPVAPPGSSMKASFVDRIFRRSSIQSANSNTIQAQIFVETAGPVSGSDRDELIEQHRVTRDLLRSRHKEIINEQ